MSRNKAFRRTDTVGLGLFAATAGTRWADAWLAANLVAAFLHSSYDGLIWRLRRPEKAQTLGATA